VEERGQSDCDEDDDEPVGPLGDPDVRGHPEPFGPGPRVRHHLAEDQAGQADGGQRLVQPARAAGVVEHEPAEDGRVADPVESGVQEGAPGT